MRIVPQKDKIVYANATDILQLPRNRPNDPLLTALPIDPICRHSDR